MAPTTPTGLYVPLTPTPSTMLLAWDFSTDDTDDPAELLYEVRYGLSTDGPGVNPMLIVPPDTGSCTLRGLLPSTEYSWSVRARNSLNEFSAWAEGPNTTTHAPPTAPTSPTITVQGPNRLRVAWGNGSDNVTPSYALKYLISVGSTNFTPFVRDDLVHNGVTHLDVLPLDGAGTYTASVQTVNAAGDVSVAAVATPVAVPATGTFAGVQSAGATIDSTILVAWDPPTETDADTHVSYKVYRMATSGGTRALLDTVTGLFFIDEDVEAGVTYWYVVRAVFPTGSESSTSPASSVEVSAMVPAGTGPTPDTTAPILGNISPAAGTPILPTASVSFDVTDDSGAFRRVLVAVTIAGRQEVVHDGVRFVGSYVGASTRVATTDGLRFSVRRVGGWSSSPSFSVYAFDASGNEVVDDQGPV